jgi:hypothetical protein
MAPARFGNAYGTDRVRSGPPASMSAGPGSTASGTARSSRSTTRWPGSAPSCRASGP